MELKLEQLKLESAGLSPTGSTHTEDYFPNEYIDPLSSVNWSDQEEFFRIGTQLSNTTDVSSEEDVLRAADFMQLGPELSDVEEQSGREETPNLAKFILWKQTQELELQSEDVEYNDRERIGERRTQFQGLAQEMGEQHFDNWEPLQEDECRKKPLCRHFLKGYCRRGKACDFLHDASIFCGDTQNVFLGGLPPQITEIRLRRVLEMKGFNVINKPKILRGFSPRVCMSSVEDAQRLIKMRKILIDGYIVEIRPYEAFNKETVNRKFQSYDNRSVFLGGLCEGTTSEMIKEDLQKVNVKVVNHPLVKTGFSPKVTVGTVEQKEMLLKLKKVRINDILVDVRPYRSYKSSFSPYRKEI